MRKTIFTKYSNDRADCFSIRTDILEDETGARVVQKIPMHPEAKRHLGNLSRWKESLDKVYSGCGYVMDRGRSLENGGVELEYIQGETLEEKLDGMLKAGQTEAVAKELEQFVETVCRPAKGQAFVMTEQFREVFGEVDLPKGQESLEVTDIDLICGNVVLGGPGEPMTVIDYEWCFDFPIPVTYLAYRILLYYIYTKSARTVLEKYDLFSRAGISQEQITAYEKMERSFQQYINRAHVPLHEVFGGYAAGKLPLEEMIVRERYHLSNTALQVFYDRGAGYVPGDSNQIFMEDGHITAEIPIPGDVRGIRLDPGMEPGICHLEELCLICGDGRKIEAAFMANGDRVKTDTIYFSTEDPQIIIQEVGEDAVKLAVSLQIYQADAHVMEQLSQKTRQLAAVREKYRRQLGAMENTKVWKAYRAYRRLIERKK